ncbi:glycoside hydrolase family 25 protein [Nitratireductor soli]|uniref:glycoside hydrolase family 25 protein n=1 Tax=Nitratireductor soli TaxID=1670619 RepID=UPI00065E3CC1|nr:GH25 family lysozyme [Nitratireductor soli]
MRRLLIASLSAFLVGCSTVSYNFSDVAPASGAADAPRQASLPTTPRGGLRFGDTDPHPWEGRAPWHYSVHGTDVAKYQAEIDWREVRRNHISFAFIKATEGGDRVDDYFSRNWLAARVAGIPRGAYHFYYFCRPAIEQARWFIRNVPRDASALPPVLDMEWNPQSPTCKLRPPAETVRSEMRIFLEAVERHYGKRPIIYTSVDFFDDNDLSRFHGYPFWLRSVAGHPNDKYSNHPWTFWQYTGTGVVPGIDGKADINVFNGSAGTWKKWLAANTGR